MLAKLLARRLRLQRLPLRFASTLAPTTQSAMKTTTTDGEKMTSPGNTPRWYLIQTKPRQDARAEEHLLRQGFTCYRPLQPDPSGKAKKPESLFPGYLFIHLDRDLDNWYPIRSTRGVTRVVSFGGEPAAVRDELIEHLQQRLAAEQRAAEPASFAPGERVQIRGDGFEDIEAIFVCSDGQQRSVILLKIGRAHV